MKIELEDRKDIVIIHLQGDLDVFTVDTLINKFEELKYDYKNIVFNFAEVNFIDSIGIENIIKLFQENPNHNYLINNLNSEVEELFNILNLKELLGSSTFVKKLEERKIN